MLALASLISLVAVPAGASDGQLEINHAIALAGGVSGNLADDPPGYPVEISRPGSYRLTGDLTPGVGQTGIWIEAHDVRVDFGGFAIRGPVTCTGTPTACSAVAAPLNGIEAAPGTRGTRLLNGRIRGMGDYGARLTTAAEIEGMEFAENREGGLFASGDAVVVRSEARANGGIGGGFTLLGRALVRDCVSANNANLGFLVGDESRIHGVVAAGNFLGIKAEDRLVLSDSVVSGSTLYGLSGHDGTLRGVTANGNGSHGIEMTFATIADSLAAGNGGDGLKIGTGTVSNSTAQGNSDCGLRMDNGGFGGNTFVDNNASGIRCGAAAHTQQVSGANLIPTSCNVIECANGQPTLLCPGLAGFSCP
jgi:hypothetical protein